jgi:putative DNA primase/helicase
MAAPHSNFLKYIGTPFERYILPIIPAKATLKPREDGKPGIAPENLGKIPGRYLPYTGAWVGFWNWQNHRTKKNDLERWQGWQTADVPIAIGMQTAEFPVVDIDSDDPEIVAAICTLATAHLGWSPVRCREESPRRVLCYKWTPGPNHDRMPVRKMRFAFAAEGKTHVIEILGSGQQVVIEGPHAKGKMHYWLDEKGLAESHSELVDIAAAEASKFIAAVRGWVEEQGFTPVKLTLPTSSGRAAAVKIGNIMSPHLATNTELLARCVRAIDINADCLADYGAWIRLLVAIKAACGGDHVFFLNVVWPWLEGNAENARRGIEEMEAKWRSFHDSQLGADYVYDTAAIFGFTVGVDERNSRIAREAFGERDMADGRSEGVPSPDAEPGLEGDGAGSAQSGGSGGNSSGPLPFTFTDMAVSDLCATRLAAERRCSTDQGWVKLKSGVWVKDDTIMRPISEICAEVGAPYRAQGPQQAKIDIMLNSAHKHQAVERTMRHHPKLAVDKDDFDADPWLLNTPGGIVDLRNGSLREHGALMRLQTAVTPDILAFMDYEAACPRWMAYLRFIADGRAEVIPFLKRWGGYGLVGMIIGPHFLFIHGLPGTGKTVFIDVLTRLLASYGAPVSKSFFMRVLDKRTFELYQLFKKRAAFADETPKGATWDEMMLLAMHNGSELRAEGKGRDFINFRNTATVTITGNHKPHFVTSSEESGIDRRLLMLTMNKKIAEHMPDDELFAGHIVRDEGPGIMMFFVEGAMEGYQSLEKTNSFLGDLVEPFKLQAAEYRREANPFLEWIGEEMELNSAKDVEAKDAFRAFTSFMHDQNPRFHISKADFRDGLSLATNGEVSYQRRSSGVNKGRWVFDGLTFSDGDAAVDGAGNVVRFPTHLNQ